MKKNGKEEKIKIEEMKLQSFIKIIELSKKLFKGKKVPFAKESFYR